MRGVPQVQVANAACAQSNGTEQDGPQDVDVLGVEIIPDLAVAVQSAASVNVNVFPAELEERCGVLEHLLEGIGLPVVCVIGEENVSSDVHVHVLQKGEI